MTLLLDFTSSLKTKLRRGKLFHNLLDELEHSERFSHDELIDRQNQKLRDTIRQAYNSVPYYKQLFKRLDLTPEAINTVDDLQLLPVMRKSDIRAGEKQFVSEAVRLKTKTTTSGTTGTPVTLYRDRYSINLEHASIWRQRRWGGVDLNDTIASLRGDIVAPADADRPPFWRYVPAENCWLMSAYHLCDRFIPNYLEHLRNSQISAIEGYPSAIYRLAGYMRDHQEEPIPVKAVFTSSEELPDYRRRAIEHYFGRVFDRYGQSERVAHIAMCERGNHHYTMDYSVIEFLPTEYSDLYKIVGTTLHNAAMPLIRYDTNDLARISHRTCDCGRAFPVVDSIAGRLEDYIATPAGKSVGGMGIAFGGVANIVEGQIIQERLDLLRVLIVATADFNDKDRNVLLKNMRSRLGEDLEIIVQPVDSIPRTRSGKFTTTVSKLECSNRPSNLN